MKITNLSCLFLCRWTTMFA